MAGWLDVAGAGLKQPFFEWDLWGVQMFDGLFFFDNFLLFHKIIPLRLETNILEEKVDFSN